MAEKKETAKAEAKATKKVVKAEAKAGPRLKELYNKEFKISDMLEPFQKMYCSSEVRLSCPNSLKKITLEKILQVLQAENDPVIVDQNLAEPAKNTLTQMLELAQS